MAFDPAPLVSAPGSPSGADPIEADPAELQAALELIEMRPRDALARIDQPPIDRGRVRTPRGVHVSDYGKELIVDLWKSIPRPTQDDISSIVSVPQSTVSRVILRRAPTDADRAAIFQMARQEPAVAPGRIASELKLMVRTVQQVLNDDAPLPPPPGTRTPTGRHVSALGKAELLRRHDADPSKPLRALARDMKMGHKTAGRLINRQHQADALAGWKTPTGRHLNAAGEARVLELASQDPAPALNAIGRQMDITPETVVRVIVNESNRSRPNPLLSADQTTLTPEGRLAVQAMRQRVPQPSKIAIALDLTVTPAMVSWAIKQPDAARPEQAPAALEAPAPRWPVVPLQRLEDAELRSWSAGERFTVPIDGVPALFEFNQPWQPGQPLDRRHFRPVLRGG